jgi:hypothetical protein
MFTEMSLDKVYCQSEQQAVGSTPHFFQPPSLAGMF